MDDVLLDLVLARLDQTPLNEEAVALLLAACEGGASLAAQLSGDTSTTPDGSGRGVTAEPAGAYLRSITVAGFRGVGPASTLELEPGPGLTLLVGRNGSGKSSFADGLEVLLTGGLRRWQELSAVWQDGWRNLHVPDPARLSTQLLLEDAGPATVERTWASGARFADSKATVQVTGEKRAGLDRLAWRDALVTYRPFLSHSELEAFFSGPSRLYDLLYSVLGMEDLTAAERLLSAARKERENGLAEVNMSLPPLLQRLGSVDDERARSCHEALAGKEPDLVRALAITTGSRASHPGSEIGRLRQLSQLTTPAQEQVQDAIASLRAAAETLDRTVGSDAGRALALAGLLSSALDHYHAHGAGPCPVCGQAGALDERWHDQTKREVARLRGQAAAAHQARAQASSAKASSRELFRPLPTTLVGPPIGSADPASAQQAWSAWAGHPDEDDADGLRRLADHIEQAWPQLHEAVTALVESASTELQAREDRWAPIAADATAWCQRASEVKAAARAVPALKAAIIWLKGAADDIRNERLAPLGEQARQIWAQLRQESNIDLGAIRLTGSGPRRQVDMDVTVDGSPSAALGVMSQGEVNALALSVFLPRATLAASPFRFLVIDDPVQAMDPAKVDGLARVLEAVSGSRQVLVFTHDDRLPEAVRRLDIPAHILEVTRRPESVVQIRQALTPVERSLEDAQALCSDETLPEAVAAQVVPGLCRLAVEAAFTEAIRRKQLQDGKRHAEVEAGIDAANTLTKRAALAMFGDASKGGEVLRRLNAWQPSIADTYQAVNKGAHNGHQEQLQPLVTQTRQLIDALRRRLS